MHYDIDCRVEGLFPSVLCLAIPVAILAGSSNFLQPLVTIRIGCFCEPLAVERDG